MAFFVLGLQHVKGNLFPVVLQGGQEFGQLLPEQVDFLSTVVLVAEMGDFGLDPAVKQSGKFNGDKVHMSKRGSFLARRILHMVALKKCQKTAT